MSPTLLSPEEAGEELLALAERASTAVHAPADLVDRVLRERRRRLRLRRALVGGGACLAVAGSAAAATLGTGDFVTMTQPSGAMEPTIAISEQVILSRSTQPEFGDVVQVTWSDDGQTFEGLSRVVGLEGDVVSCPRNPAGGCDAVLVNGEPVSDPYLATLTTPPFPATVVPDDSLFLLGDNRRNAADSRLRGSVDVDAVSGVAVEILSHDGDERPVPGAPVRSEPGDDQVIDPAEPVPPAFTAPGSG